jgi:hypothetical protein
VRELVNNWKHKTLETYIWRAVFEEAMAQNELERKEKYKE